MVGFRHAPLFWYQWSIMGSTMGNDAEYREIVRLLGTGELRPIVDRYSPSPRRGRVRAVGAGRAVGKIAIEISS